MNLRFPFYRDKTRDFATAEGEDLLLSQLRLTLGVMSSGPKSLGELPWRTNFGSLLQQVRNKNNTSEVQALAEVYVRNALDRWMSGTTATVTVQRVNDVMLLRVEAKRGKVKTTLETPLSQ